MDFLEERQTKKRKLERMHGPALEIKRFEDLQNALVFRKSSSSEVKKGIQAFKDFLGSIQRTKSVAEQSTKVRLLKQYCDFQLPAEEHGVAFADLISTWSYAGESNNDSVLSAVPAVLAQFLRLISSYLEFRDFGLSLCRALLQKDQVRLFDRAFSSSKSKEHLISPCLRLLTEIVAFDGGALAAQLYARKDVLFKRLDLFLEQTATKGNMMSSRSPTLRRIAQRYVIANLRFQSISVKGDLVGQGKVLHAMLKGTDRDGDDIIADILQVLQNSILNDTSLKKKSRLINITNLQSLLDLYDYEEAPPSETETHDDYVPGEGRKKVRDNVQKFYLGAFQLGNGITLPQNGWYPQGMDSDFFDSSASHLGNIDLGLDSPLHFDEYRDKIPVKNGTLSIFIQSLRPDSDDLQASLLLKILEIAPELIADYFSKTKRFVSKPKDDPEWRAQSAFLFSVVQLPVPKFCGRHDGLPELPPPASIVIENILPRVFTQADLTRCMNLAHNIITLFAAKYMTASLQKLSSTLRTFQSASSNLSIWQEASERLVRVFTQRSAPVKDIIAALQRSSKDDMQVRAALLECLANYFKTLPQNALSEKFDVATNILDTTQKLEIESLINDDRGLLLDQLRDLCIIAERSKEVRWWHKPDTADLCPFTALLRTAVNLELPTKVRKTMLRLLKAVMTEQSIIEDDEKDFDALITSLSSTKKWSPDQHTYAFLENCMSRIVRQPIKYLELLEASEAYKSKESPPSLLACCIAEQWPFIAQSNDKEAQKSIASWIACIFDAFGTSGSKSRVVLQLLEEMVRTSPEKAKAVLQKAIEKQRKRSITILSLEEGGHPEDGKDILANEDNEQAAELDLNATFGNLALPPMSIEGLTKWSPSSLESDIQSTRLFRLIRCTTSLLEEIRIQTFTILQSLLSTTQESNHPDTQRLHLLLGELLETIKLYTLSQPLPTIVSSMTILLLRILTDPADKMYSKANRFLLRSPRWDISKLPSYWITQILLREAEDDDGSNLEVDRMLVMMIDGLQSEADMELYRKNAVFERCLSLWWSPHVVDAARRKICHLVWKGWQVGHNGRMTLLTRCGIRGWVESALLNTRTKEERTILEALRREIEQVEGGDEGRKWKEGRGVPAKSGKSEDLIMEGV